MSDSTVYTKPAVRTAWGENNQTSADMIDPDTESMPAASGWPESATPPARQFWNWALFFLFAAVRYFMQRGIVDWDTGELYQAGARVIGPDGLTYMSLQNTNTGQTPVSNPTWWIRWGFSMADLILAINTILDTIIIVPFSTTPVFDASLGSQFQITLTGPVTAPTLINVTPGQKITFMIVQDSTGNRTFTWPSNVQMGTYGGNVNSAANQMTIEVVECCLDKI